ncbi:hypothetical protein ACWGDS_22025 [Streptomyces sp. NPDC055059]
MLSPDQDHPTGNHVRLPLLRDRMDRRGLTDPFWSNANPCGTFHLDMHKRLDLAPLAVSRAGTPSKASALVWAGAARTSCPSDSTITFTTGEAAAARITAGVTVEVSCRRDTGW